MPTRSVLFCFIAFTTAAWLWGCSGGGAAPPRSLLATTPPAPTTSPTAPPAGALTLSQSTIAFSAPDQSATVTASEKNYSGPIDVDAGACGTAVNVTPSSATSAPAHFNVTAQASGSCTVTFTDQFGQTATLSIGVTVTHGTIQ